MVSLKVKLKENNRGGSKEDSNDNEDDPENYINLDKIIQMIFLLHEPVTQREIDELPNNYEEVLLLGLKERLNLYEGKIPSCEKKKDAFG